MQNSPAKSRELLGASILPSRSQDRRRQVSVASVFCLVRIELQEIPSETTRDQ